MDASRGRSASSPNPDVETEAMGVPLLLGCISASGRLEMKFLNRSFHTQPGKKDLGIISGYGDSMLFVSGK
jgi:hypothetical protein